MLNKFLLKLFGSRNDRLLKGYQEKIFAINSEIAQLELYTDQWIYKLAQELKGRAARGSIENELPLCFALVREAIRRELGFRLHSVQLIGALALNEGKIAEMKTGEGKTVAALPALYFNSLLGSAHAVTVNSYLATRDAAIAERILKRLGVTVAAVVPGMDAESRKAAYASDIVYGTATEFGFDYLRDNLARKNASVACGDRRDFVVVDEVDSVFIDEARTPLIISGEAPDGASMAELANKLAKEMVEESGGLFEADKAGQRVYLTEAGMEYAEQWLEEREGVSKSSVYLDHGAFVLHYLVAALRAHVVYHRDHHYVIQEGDVVIIDENTGRLMPGRRWEEGLHQAIEAKEGCEINPESITLASITLQNFFRMYQKISGMTGTAITDAAELSSVYGTEVVEIPTAKPSRRLDRSDLVFQTRSARDEAVVLAIQEANAIGRPVLVGTTSVSASERIAGLLKRKGLSPVVLNAKNHGEEAAIVANAGRVGSITVATNMAGRGTDISLGGSIDVAVAEIESNDNIKFKHLAISDAMNAIHGERELIEAAGGLLVIGVERNTSRRIDNQLAGRSGRQGDVGESRFYLSLEDDLLAQFNLGSIKKMVAALNIPASEAISLGMIDKAVRSAQSNLDHKGFEARKHLLEYDETDNAQRRVIYARRAQALAGAVGMEVFEDMLGQVIRSSVGESLTEHGGLAGLDESGFIQTLYQQFGVSIHANTIAKADDENDLIDSLEESIRAGVMTQLASLDQQSLHQIIGAAVAHSIDECWQHHLLSLDSLRQGVQLRAIAQKNVLQEYKRDAYALFERTLHSISESAVSTTLASARSVQAPIAA